MKKYLQLTKPGIIFGNLVTCAGGFALASCGHFDPWLLLMTLLGLSLIIASGCVSNNYIDRNHDGKMERTKNRALVKGEITPQRALGFAVILVILGTSILAVFVNFLAVVISLIGLVVYLAFYSFLKYRSVHGTLIGSVAGAVPPVVGYTAVSHHIDLAALIFFLMIAMWQMPHFYAIALYRMEEYKKAAIPVLPLAHGIPSTKIQMLLYIIFFIPLSLTLVFFGYVGALYMIVAALLGFIWLGFSIQGFRCKKDAIWARKMFLCSLVVVMGICIIIPFSVV
ncbi:MAG: Protoheme IX farnesyltransferase [Chlamydiales bacterium]|nr:Protoheme IX farnesyltransferase [Chlamydiales bacterium]